MDVDDDGDRAGETNKRGVEKVAHELDDAPIMKLRSGVIVRP